MQVWREKQSRKDIRKIASEISSLCQSLKTSQKLVGLRGALAV
jgi:hypothetical protein